MDLPDCPPGAEGYQDSVTEVPKKPELDESSCTKAEYEFQEHLNSLKIRLEDGGTRCMVERRGRDISGKWIYLCYPCAAVCSGESILQTHISGKKHKIKLSMRNVWPNSIFDDHPFNQTTVKTGATEKVLQRMAEEVDNHNRNPSDLDQKYNKYRTVTCHIQDSLDAVKAPLLGVEYLIEHPPEQSHYEPTYMCTLCNKQGHPRTIINHMTCFWHRYNFLVRHFPTACGLLAPYRSQTKYRDGVNVIMNRLAQRIEDKYGRKRPVNIDKEEYEKDKVQIHEWVFRSHHFNEKDGPSFTEVVDIGLIDSLLKSNEDKKTKTSGKDKTREPSPPIVAAPSKPLFNNFSDPDVYEDLTASFLLPARRKRKRPATRTAQRARERAKREAKRELALATPKSSAALATTKSSAALATPKSSAALATTKSSAALATPKSSAALATTKSSAALATTKSSAALATPKSSAALATPKSSAALATTKSSAALATTKSSAALATPKSSAALATPKSSAALATTKSSAALATTKSSAALATPKAPSVPPNLGLSPMVITEINKPLRSISPELDNDVYQMNLTISPTRPSPPVPPAPVYSKALANRPAGRQERRAGSVESLSDISDDDYDSRRVPGKDRRVSRDRHDSFNKVRFEPYDKRRGASPPRNRQASRLQPSKSQEKQQRPPNYEYKVKLAEEKRQSVEDSLKKTLAYHEKNPEKHPLYPEEWKKFWNRRYKEIQAEGKDPSKHDFKPEWIVFWTARMKELHEDELRVQVIEIYRRMCLSPPDMSKRVSSEKTHVPEPHRKPSEPRRKSPEPRRRSPEPRRRSPEPRRRSPEPRRRSPELRRRSPDPRRRSADRRQPERYDRLREPLPPRRRTPPPDLRRDRRSPLPHPPRRSPPRRRTPERRRSPPPPVHLKRTRSRSPLHRRSPGRPHAPPPARSSSRSSRSPLSQREQQRNRSPEHGPRAPPPCLQTVLISDDELKPDDGLSPWNSDNDIESVASASSNTRRAADDVVATLRQLVALEDYLGSLGPKIVDLLADALKMEKEKANSSEELLERESAVVLIETAKEKLKGAVQAGLVGGSAAHALRAAVVRAAATLHEADKRTRLRQKQNPAPSKTAAVPVAVAGVGEVDRAQIAQQMAEALIAQGKTDVSSEDLAVLVDAVVGMAEAKKRAAEQTKKVVPTPVAVVEKPVIRPVLPKQSGTASALQMLQSAYDENDKKMDSSNTPDAMDGLSDSDLETLLKNFNELSAEEQHSLIAYLKKLEAKEPERVERLRQYVSEAASTAPKELTPEENKEDEEKPAKTVVLESDDDDYTVEEVFKSATQKVKEDQIRQEMEIVKKSLEETKPEPTIVEPAKLENSLADITRSLSTSSATDLFALVQASIKSTSAAPAPLSHSSNVVVSNTQPRSFGDLPEPTVTQEPSKPVQSGTGTTPFNNQAQGPEPGRTPFQSLQGLLRPSARFQAPQQQQQQRQPQQNYQSPQHNQQNYQSPPVQQQNYQPPQQNQQQNYQPPQQNQQQNYQPPQQNQQDNYQPLDQNQQDNYQPPLRNQQQNYQPSQQNQQQPLYNQGQQKNYQPPQHNQGPQHNQMLPPLAQRNQPQHQQYAPQHQQYQPPQHQQHQPPPQHQHQPPQHQQHQPPQHQQQHFNDNRNMASDNFNQGQWNPRPNNMDNRGPPMRGPAPDNFGHNAPYNQGPRNNFMNGRGQDNYDTRPPMNQQFGNNYDNNQSNFRGRGGGRGNFRGRGRGYY